MFSPSFASLFKKPSFSQFSVTYSVMSSSLKSKIECLVEGWVKTQIESAFQHMLIPPEIKLVLATFIGLWGYLSIDSLIMDDEEKL